MLYKNSFPQGQACNSRVKLWITKKMVSNGQFGSTTFFTAFQYVVKYDMVSRWFLGNHHKRSKFQEVKNGWRHLQVHIIENE